jgi:hypothetical protein
MFTVKAAFSDDIEMMPGVERAGLDAEGKAQWRVEAEIPLVGKMVQNFSLELAESTPDRVEWSPAQGEDGNLLRYSADFLEAGGVTKVHFSQQVELRRRKASELHSLAWLAGESLISREMTASITQMIRTFIERAKAKLER